VLVSDSVKVFTFMNIVLAVQHQILRCPNVRLGKIEAIFITHLHGDHLFGLPGLLCTISATTTPEDTKVLTLVGPTGIAGTSFSSLLIK
jgi:ribonuclease BN (tRNA processing enzyme)